MKIKPEIGTPVVNSKFRIEIDPIGPYLVYGIPSIRKKTIIQNSDGDSWEWLAGDINYIKPTEPTALCRCGHTKTPPYCDGSHLKADWDPTLTAPLTPLLDDAELQEGPTLSLTDNEAYCAFARFCDAKGRTWNQIERSDEPNQRDLAIRTASNCPAGRLKVWDNDSQQPIEPKLPSEIGLIEDTKMRCSGPIFVTGGILITVPSQNIIYQPRNRVTLCRCGNSSNKPFCDGTHTSSRYHDKL